MKYPPYMHIVFGATLLICQLSISAEETFKDSSNGLEINFPGEPQKIKNEIRTHTVRVYNYEDSIDGKLLFYHVYVTSKSNGESIQYKDSDFDLALRNFAIGSLAVYGVNGNEIKFQTIETFYRKVPAVRYYTDGVNNGLIAEGVSCLVNGRHVKIGIVYDPAIKKSAQEHLEAFLNSFKME